MIDLLVVDDHALFRAGLRKVLGDESDLRVVDEAGDWLDGCAKLERHAVDVLLLDINLPDRSGLDALEVIRHRCPALRVILLSMHSQAQYALRAIRSGARGYVRKDMEIDQLLDAIRCVARGGMFFEPEIIATLVEARQDSEAASPHEALSARESEVLRLTAAGESPGAIATQLAISVKTVSTYRRRVLDKLGLDSNAQLVQYALRHKLLE